jgi:iron(III) transport system permease protein
VDAQAESLTIPLPHRHAERRWLPAAWSGLLIVVLTFLILYPTAMLLIGALTTTNPVVEGYHFADLSIVNFLKVLTNPNVAEALANSLIACGGGTIVAVTIGLSFAWVVVRTNTPCKALIASAGMLPLFVPPLVAGVAWSILG